MIRMLSGHNPGIDWKKPATMARSLSSEWVCAGVCVSLDLWVGRWWWWPYWGAGKMSFPITWCVPRSNVLLLDHPEDWLLYWLAGCFAGGLVVFWCNPRWRVCMLLVKWKIEEWWEGRRGLSLHSQSKSSVCWQKQRTAAGCARPHYYKYDIVTRTICVSVLILWIEYHDHQHASLGLKIDGWKNVGGGCWSPIRENPCVRTPYAQSTQIFALFYFVLPLLKSGTMERAKWP